MSKKNPFIWTRLYLKCTNFSWAKYSAQRLSAMLYSYHSYKRKYATYFRCILLPYLFLEFDSFQSWGEQPVKVEMKHSGSILRAACQESAWVSPPTARWMIKAGDWRDKRGGMWSLRHIFSSGGLLGHYQVTCAHRLHACKSNIYCTAGIFNTFFPMRQTLQ